MCPHNDEACSLIKMMSSPPFSEINPHVPPDLSADSFAEQIGMVDVKHIKGEEQGSKSGASRSYGFQPICNLDRISLQEAKRITQLAW